MKVDVGYGLMGWYAVVLPDFYTPCAVGPNDRCNRLLYELDQDARLAVVQIQQRRCMPPRNYKKVRVEPLLRCHQHSCVRRQRGDRIRSASRKYLTVGAVVTYRNL